VPNLDTLRDLIEQVAVQLVLVEPQADQEKTGKWMPVLERIRVEATRGEAVEVAAIAAEILQSLDEAASPDLPEGIARLQQALESASKGGKPLAQPLAQDQELLSDFILESREHLANIETRVLELERDPSASEALHDIFRGFHTIKGLAGFLELAEIQELAHEVETVLDRARNSELIITPAAIDVILQGADYLGRWLAHLESASQGHDAAVLARDESLLARIRALSSATSNQPPQELLAMAAAVEDGGPDPAASPPPEGRAAHRSEATAVRVDTGKLDYLVDMAGEMVIAESLVRHDPELKSVKSPRLQRNLAQLTRITAELQKTAMAMRLVPIGPLFRRMERLVRDLARQFGKSVEMGTEGDDIELDRNIVEELADPLMHMVRNALDHGIELPADRLARGKGATAHLGLRAQHRAGQVVIEITDDGRGLDREKIVAKAIERGLIQSGDGLSDSEIYNLIFLPGFSTAEQVTSVSGRGVGMDVVRRHIEKLRGRIEIRSTAGQGSTFLLKLPLTLAIIDGLVVGVGEERYIVPLFAVREMFRPAQGTIWTVQQRAEMALVRGALLPVLRLYARFRVTPRSEDSSQSVLVVAETEGQRFCLLVDELIGKQEVVIKSLGETFKSITGIAGGAILGDGRVGLILDLDRLFKDRAHDATH